MKKVLPFVLVIIFVCACALSGCAGRSSGPADLPDGGETAAPGSAPGGRHFTGKKLLHALVTALLMALFAWGILLTTGSFCFEIQ